MDSVGIHGKLSSEVSVILKASLSFDFYYSLSIIASVAIILRLVYGIIEHSLFVAG